MKTAWNINLASEPFRRDRPILVGAAATAILMVLVCAMQLYLISIERGEGTETAQAIQESRSRLQEFTAEEARLQATLQRPENEAVLERSVFLNTLLMRKGISWTLIFADLQEVVPYNVKIVQIRPQVTPGNEIHLEMVVAAQAIDPVIEMLKAVETSELFSSTSVSASLPPTESEPLYRYRVSVRYDRKL